MEKRLVSSFIMFENIEYERMIIDWINENRDVSLFCNENLDWLISDRDLEFDLSPNSRFEELSVGSSYLWF